MNHQKAGKKKKGRNILNLTKIRHNEEVKFNNTAPHFWHTTFYGAGGLCLRK